MIIALNRRTIGLLVTALTNTGKLNLSYYEYFKGFKVARLVG